MTVKQHRDTRQRKLILDAVRRHTDHPSADQIFIEVRSTDSKISRGTVYRNLNYLADAGEITHVRAPVPIAMKSGQISTITFTAPAAAR